MGNQELLFGQKSLYDIKRHYTTQKHNFEKISVIFYPDFMFCICKTPPTPKRILVQTRLYSTTTTINTRISSLQKHTHICQMLCILYSLIYLISLNVQFLGVNYVVGNIWGLKKTTINVPMMMSSYDQWLPPPSHTHIPGYCLQS